MLKSLKIALCMVVLLVQPTLLFSFTCEAYLPFTINVNKQITESYTASLCKGSDYTEHGFNLQNIQKDTVCVLNGECSKSILTVTIKYNSTEEFNGSVCAGSDYNENGFSVQNIQKDTICYREADCNKYTLNLKVIKNSETELNDAICNGDDYVKNGFSIENPQKDTICVREEGCHKYILNLKVNSTKETNFYESICEGSVYTKHEFHASEVGTYTQHLTAKCGCDSTVNLFLNVIPNSPITLTDNCCIGTPYSGRGYDEIWVTQDTILENSTLVNGCSSKVYLYLTANKPSSTQITDTISIGDSYTKYNFNFVARTDTTAILNLSSLSNCDSIVTLHLAVCENVSTTFKDTICEGYTYNEHNFKESETGLYHQVFETEMGCDSIVTLDLFVSKNITTVLYDTIGVGTKYDKYNFDFIAHSDTLAYFYGNTTLGCDSIVELVLTVHIGGEDLYIPRFFTPNGDGKNDTWLIRNINRIPGSIVEIFDRYGRRITIIQDGEIESWKGWDGNYNGHPMPNDDYWYTITLGDSKERYSGHFILKR